jgi:PadR family transcriptional regulator, regulatory protein PadR
MARHRVFSPEGKRVLTALLASPTAWRFGYDLIKELGLKSGTLYPLLMRLKDRDILDAKWDDPPFNGRPPRQLYRLTPHGIGIAIEALGESAPASLGLYPQTKQELT